VQQHIAIGVPAEAPIMRQRDTANLQRNPGTKFMRIKPVANSQSSPSFAADSRGSTLIFFLSFSQTSRRNRARTPKFSRNPTSMSVARN
jgi:hypothetical protein